MVIPKGPGFWGDHPKNMERSSHHPSFDRMHANGPLENIPPTVIMFLNGCCMIAASMSAESLLTEKLVRDVRNSMANQNR